MAKKKAEPVEVVQAVAPEDQALATAPSVSEIDRPVEQDARGLFVCPGCGGLIERPTIEAWQVAYRPAIEVSTTCGACGWTGALVVTR